MWSMVISGSRSSFSLMTGAGTPVTVDLAGTDLHVIERERLRTRIVAP
jgi:hypothetical protein